MDQELDVEETIGGRERCSLSMRQVLLLVFALYFAGTCGLFAMVEKGLLDSVSASDGVSDDQGGEITEEPENESPEPPAQPGPGEPEAVTPQERLEIYVADGHYPALSRVGDRYAISFTRSDAIWVTYSDDGMNWTEPLSAASANISGAQAGLGTLGWAGSHDGVFLLFFVSTVADKSGRRSEPRIFLTRSSDGELWGEPTMLPHPSSIRLDQISGISMVERSNGELVLAFVGDYGDDDTDVFIMTSMNGEDWEVPTLARTVSGGTLRGGFHARVLEINGTLQVAHADDLRGRVHFSTQGDAGWTTILLSGQDMWPYFSWVSAARLGNGSTVVAFDHLASNYIMYSGHGVEWGEPLRVGAGAQPTVLAVGNESLMMAYIKDRGIYTTFVGGEHWSPWSEGSYVQSGGEMVLHFRAWIDGSDRVYVRNNEVWYLHRRYEYPGLWQAGGGVREEPYPTYINGQEWFPDWPNGTTKTDQRCLNNYTALDPPLPMEPSIVGLKVIEERGSIYVEQEPMAENDYTTIIMLDDTFGSGAAWYEFELYAASP